MSICSIEDVAAHTGKPFWFQLYVMRDRDFIERLIERAKAAGCSALVLTLDLQILGPAPQGPEERPDRAAQADARQPARHRDQAALVRWACSAPSAAASATSSATSRASTTCRSLGAWTAEQFDPTLNWDDVEVDQEALGRQADPEGHPRRRGRAARRATAAPTRSSSPTTAAASSTARRRRSGAAGDRRGGRHAHRGLDGRRHPLRPGRAQGAGARRRAAR